MSEKVKSRIQQLRFTGILEGISFIVLLVIAMPVKYYLGNPLPVKYTGWAHGLLFILYILAVLRAATAAKWTIKRTLIFLVASFIPLATFYLDASLKEEAALAER